VAHIQEISCVFRELMQLGLISFSSLALTAIRDDFPSEADQSSQGTMPDQIEKKNLYVFTRKRNIVLIFLFNWRLIYISPCI
jgi:hypothetical protein